MTDDLGAVVSYICSTYPHLSDLSNARLTKLVYLADWRAARAGMGQLTNIDWIFNHYGPWVPDVLAAAQTRDDLDVISDVNFYGSPKVRVKPRQGAAPAVLSAQTKAIIDTVVADTQRLYFGEFIEYVYATTPVRQSPRGSHLDLEAFAAAESLDPLPATVAENQLKAEEFAAISEQLHQAVSRVLLDVLWVSEVGGDGLIETNTYLVNDLDIDTFKFNSDIRLTQGRASCWTGQVSLEATTSALVLRDEAARERMYEDDGYDLLDGEWDDFYVLIGREFSGDVSFTVTREETVPSVALSRIRLD